MPDAKSLRILVAEDNKVNQKLVTTLLEKQGHVTVTVSNGREVLAALADFAFDVVLMDVQMPEMCGFEATAAIRKREEATGEHIPILALTAHAMTGDRERCLAAGMDEYLSKPIRARALYEALDNLMARSQGALTQGHVEALESAPAPPQLGPSLLESQFAGDTELLQTLVEIFRGELPLMLAKIEECLGGGDCQGIEQAAHKLKGSVAIFRSETAYRAADRLEGLARAGDLRNVFEAFAHLKQAMRALEEALLDYKKQFAG